MAGMIKEAIVETLKATVETAPVKSLLVGCGGSFIAGMVTEAHTHAFAWAENSAVNGVKKIGGGFSKGAKAAAEVFKKEEGEAKEVKAPAAKAEAK